MLEETSPEEKKAETQILLEKFRSAVNQPRLYVYQFFEDLRNDIDVQSCKTLNETNKERIYEQQAELISKVQEFESLCLEHVNVDSAIDFQGILEQTESKLNGPVVSQVELEAVNELLSNELLKLEKVLFQNKCMFFLKASETDDDHDLFDWEASITNNLEFLSIFIKHNKMSGLLIEVEDCLIRREVMSKK
jgi:hypothetical protein